MNSKDPYENLRLELSKTKDWPLVYMFKFIIPSDPNRIELIKSKFNSESIVTSRESANGKYTSITITEAMISADEIIRKYKDMEGVEGLIAL